MLEIFVPGAGWIWAVILGGEEMLGPLLSYKKKRPVYGMRHNLQLGRIW